MIKTRTECVESITESALFFEPENNEIFRLKKASRNTSFDLSDVNQRLRYKFVLLYIMLQNVCGTSDLNVLCTISGARP